MLIRPSRDPSLNLASGEENQTALQLRHELPIISYSRSLTSLLSRPHCYVSTHHLNLTKSILVQQCEHLRSYKAYATGGTGIDVGTGAGVDVAGGIGAGSSSSSLSVFSTSRIFLNLFLVRPGSPHLS